MKSETSFSLPFNRHGHMTIEVTGLGLTGKQEIERLEPSYAIGYRARHMLKGEKCGNAYDKKKHRLAVGECCRLAIVSKSLIAAQIHMRLSAAKQLEEYRNFGAQFQYGFATAEVALRLREMLTDRQLEEMGFYYLAVVHEPITLFSDGSLFHVVHRTKGLPLLGSGLLRRFDERSGSGALVFLDQNL